MAEDYARKQLASRVRWMIGADFDCRADLVVVFALVSVNITAWKEV